MVTSRSWAAYPLTYRAKELNILAGWFRAGVSGSVVGPNGAGKSNLLGFLCHRPDAVGSYLSDNQVALVLVDLNNLPTNDLSSLYRVVLRSFFEFRHHFISAFQPIISEIYQANRTEQDPFLLQCLLREILLLFESHQVRVILVFDHFDHFCQTALSTMTDTLRGLRDSFKETLIYIVGVRQEVSYLSNPTVLGELYELLDSHICWVGPMNETDARQVIAEETRTALTPPIENEMVCLLALTGGYPTLLKVTCHWWLTVPNKPAIEEWLATLLTERSILYRLAEIWAGLNQEERQVLFEVQKLWHSGQTAHNQSSTLRASKNLNKQYHSLLTRLNAKGLCLETESGWQIFSSLLAAYVTEATSRGRGKIWLDEKKQELYQGATLLAHLTALERGVLTFLVNHPQLRHTKTHLIINAWPSELRQQGVSDDSLYQVIAKLREKIEPNPAKPSYLITWRGMPGSSVEGGYQFFPEGQSG